MSSALSLSSLPDTKSRIGQNAPATPCQRSLDKTSMCIQTRPLCCCRRGTRHSYHSLTSLPCHPTRLAESLSQTCVSAISLSRSRKRGLSRHYYARLPKKAKQTCPG